MHEDFEAELRESVDRFNERTVPPAAASVRARGEHFHRRKVVGTVGLAMALVAGLGITTVAATTGGGQHAVTPTTTPGTATSPASGPATTSQSRQTPAGPASSAGGSTTTSQGGTGPVDLTLHPPVQYAAGALNPVTFTVDNHGSAVSQVTVTLTLTRPKSEVANTTGPWPLDLVQRRDPATGTWNRVTVAFLNNGVDPHGEDVRVAHYTFDLPGGTSTEQLRVDPEGSFFTLGVKLATASSTLAQAQTDKIPVNFPTMTVSGPKTPLKPGATGEFDVTLTNDTPEDYSSIAFWTSDVVITSPMSSATRIQVYDGAAWRPVSLDQFGAGIVATRPLASGAATTVRLRYTLAADAPTGSTGKVGILAYVPGEFYSGNTSAGLAPGGETRMDTPFTVK